MYTSNIIERWREDFHQIGEIYQQDGFSWCIQGKLKLLDVIVIKSKNTGTIQLASYLDVDLKIFVQVTPRGILKRIL